MCSQYAHFNLSLSSICVNRLAIVTVNVTIFREATINLRTPELVDLRETWESSTQQERKDLVRIMLQEVSVDVAGLAL
jgi:hypothetical protein